MNPQQVYKSILNSAIQKAFKKNLPLILDDAIAYLEEHDWQVKERRKRSKKPSPSKNIADLEKRTDKKLSKTAEKMKTKPYLNLNTNRVHSASKQIKEKYPDHKFGHLIQGNTRVWVCGTPGHLDTTISELTENDEKAPVTFEQFSKIESISEEDEVEEPEEDEVEEPKNAVEEPENEVEEPKNAVDEPENEIEEPKNAVDEPENEVEEPKNDFVNQSLSDLSDNDNDDLDEIYKIIDLPEEEVPPPVVGSSSPQETEKSPPQIPNPIPLFLEGTPPPTSKKLKRRKRKKGKKPLKTVENEGSGIVL
jgi:hypothetical protein